MADHFDVTVIGAGIGGATCAALLAHRGLRVLVVERNARAGGKAMTVGDGGFRHELWPVVSGPSEGSRFASILEEVGATDEVELLVPDDVLALVYRSAGTSRTMVSSASPGGGGLGLIDLLSLEEPDLPGLLDLQVALTTTDDETLRGLDDVTFADWLQRVELPTSVRTDLAMQANLLFVVPIDRLAASEAIRTMADFARGGAGRYHAGGYGRVAEVCCDVVERNGGEVRTGTAVERVVVEDGRARGVVLAGGTVTSDVVVSNAGIQPTVLRLVGAEHFPGDYTDDVRALVPSWAIVGRRYELDVPFFEHGMIVTFSDDNVMTSQRFADLATGWLPEELSVFNVVPAVYDPTLAPDGRQMALVGTYCEPGLELAYLEPLLARLDESVERIWPGVSDHIVSSTSYGTAEVSRLSRDAVVPNQGGECIGLAQIVGQCGRHKPDARSPLRGLYYVGCDAGGYGCGTHQAADSGANVADIVLADLVGARSRS